MNKQISSPIFFIDKSDRASFCQTYKGSSHYYYYPLIVNFMNYTVSWYAQRMNDEGSFDAVYSDYSSSWETADNQLNTKNRTYYYLAIG